MFSFLPYVILYYYYESRRLRHNDKNEFFTILALSFKESSVLFSHQSNNKIWDRLYQEHKYFSWPIDRPYKLSFFLFCTGSVSWLSNHASRCLCPAHPQTYRQTERTGRVGTGRAERIALLVHTSTRRSLQAVEPQILDSSPSLASDEFGNVKRAKPKNFSFVHCINEVCNVELSAHSSQISESLYQ